MLTLTLKKLRSSPGLILPSRVRSLVEEEGRSPSPAVSMWASSFSHRLLSQDLDLLLFDSDTRYCLPFRDPWTVKTRSRELCEVGGR